MQVKALPDAPKYGRSNFGLSLVRGDESNREWFRFFRNLQ